LKVLETNYRGVTFRSRLEARWAVFFSELSIPFIYEPEGFEFKDGTRYLPDFYLPKQDFYVEIKPIEPSNFEREKCEFLALAVKKNIYCFYGSFLDTPECEVCSFWLDEDNKPVAAWDINHLWCQCQNCGQFGIEFEARVHRLKCKRNGCDKIEEGKEGRNETFNRRIKEAFSSAQNERFGV